MRNVEVRFECARKERVGPTLGPFEWVQLTYELLRVSPDGEELAHYADEGWRLGDDDTAYSDVIIAPTPREG